MKLVDVTLRESVYTDLNIDYEQALIFIQEFTNAINPEICEYIEIGYIDSQDSQKPLQRYHGKYIHKAKQIVGNRFKLSAMLHIESFLPEQWEEENIKQLSMVRIVVNGEYDENIKDVIQYFHSHSILVSVNCAYISRRSKKDMIEMYEKAIQAGVDIFYIADTNGSTMPYDIGEIMKLLNKKNQEIKLGIHTHNHFEMATANAVIANQYGVTYIDSTMCGYGKGAGNLKTELSILLFSKIQKQVLSKMQIQKLFQLIQFFQEQILFQKQELYEKRFLNQLYAYRNKTLNEIKQIEQKSDLATIQKLLS